MSAYVDPDGLGGFGLLLVGVLVQPQSIAIEQTRNRGVYNYKMSAKTEKGQRERGEMSDWRRN